MPNRPTARLAGALAALGLLLAAAAAAPAQAADFNCEASAVRGVVLGQQIEPVSANRNQPACKAQSATLAQIGLPLPLDAEAVVARTTLTGTAGQPATQQAAAAGGIVNLGVRALPELPIQLPTAQLPAIPAVEIPLVGSVDLTAAVRALLPDGRLPRVDLVRVRTAASFAQARCVNGKADLSGSSEIAGVSVLGQPLPVDGVVERAVTLVDTQNIDPSNANLADVPLPAGVSLDAVRPLLQQALDALPTISIPATVAQVKITPKQQVRVGDRLAQRALRVEIGLLGQALADIAIGEAAVSAQDVNCSPASVAGAALQCTKRRLVLIDVVPQGRRVKLLGAADRSLVGKRVRLVSTYDGRTVARPVVGEDGEFSATTSLPPRSIRNTNRARYQAVLGDERSLRLKLMRRLRVTGLDATSRTVTIAGRVVRPLASPARTIVVTRRVSCSRTEVVKRFKPRADGTFRVRLPAPEGQLAAVYRMETAVRKTRRNPKTYPTFTLPRAVELR